MIFKSIYLTQKWDSNKYYMSRPEGNDNEWVFHTSQHLVTYSKDPNFCGRV